jgi:hypothetical protein
MAIPGAPAGIHAQAASVVLAPAGGPAAVPSQADAA